MKTEEETMGGTGGEVGNSSRVEFVCSTPGSPGTGTGPGRYLRRLNELEVELEHWKNKAVQLEERLGQMERWKRNVDSWLFDNFAVKMEENGPSLVDEEEWQQGIHDGFSGGVNASGTLVQDLTILTPKTELAKGRGQVALEGPRTLVDINGYEAGENVTETTRKRLRVRPPETGTQQRKAMANSEDTVTDGDGTETVSKVIKIGKHVTLEVKKAVVCLERLSEGSKHNGGEAPCSSQKGLEHDHQDEDDGPDGEGPSHNDTAACDVCAQVTADPHNAFVYCDVCNVCVHQTCYGVRHIPSNGWKCSPCSEGLTTSELQCNFCPQPGGALKRVASVQDKWSHVNCALWIPEIKPDNFRSMEPIVNTHKIPPARWKLRCSLCKIPQGCCIQCQFSKRCATAFHVTCAMKHGLEMKEVITEDDSGMPQLEAFCQTHTYQSNAKNQKKRRKPSSKQNGQHSMGSDGSDHKQDKRSQQPLTSNNLDNDIINLTDEDED